jgi:hypothetical protein
MTFYVTSFFYREDHPTVLYCVTYTLVDRRGGLVFQINCRRNPGAKADMRDLILCYTHRLAAFADTDALILTNNEDIPYLS